LFVLKLLGSFALVVLTLITKTVQGIAFVAGAVQEHLKDLLNPPAVIARVEAA
jgi:hypothetical protein